MQRDNLLIVADSEHDANMLYAVGMFVPDPFIYLRLRGRDLVVMSDLELDRAHSQAAHCRVISLSECRQKLRHQGIQQPGSAQIIRLLLRDEGIGQVQVPDNFPHGLANELNRLKVKVKVKPGGFFPKREQKNASEVKKISAALTMAEVGLAEAIQALKSAKIGRNRRLMYHNAPLTSEKLRAIINTAIICGFKQ